MIIQHSASSAAHIVPLPAFSDNYIWLIHNGREAAVVDPGNADVVTSALERLSLTLTTILLTHHHHDHTGGVELLDNRYSPQVIGPKDQRITGITHPVSEGDTIRLDCLEQALTVIEVPGHTTSHIAFLGQDMVFVGDTLFSAGCGRLLGGSAEQLHASLQRLAALPKETRIYCAHEYTLANLRFSKAVEAHNPARDDWERQCQALRAADTPTLPTTLSRELAVNPFLRTDEDQIRLSASRHCGRQIMNGQDCFTELRKWKDTF